MSTSVYNSNDKIGSVKEISSEKIFCVLPRAKSCNGEAGKMLTLEELFAFIKNGKRINVDGWSDVEIKQYKESLPYLCDPKKFQTARGVVSGDSGFLTIDIDHVTEKTGYSAEKIRDVLAQSPFCVLSARSSTFGVWALFRGFASEFETPEAMQSAIYVAIDDCFVRNFIDISVFSDNGCFDGSVNRGGQGRFLAGDVDAKRGPAFYDRTACLRNVNLAEAKEAFRNSELYGIIAAALKPAFRFNPAWVARSHSCAGILAAISLAFPSKGENYFSTAIFQIASMSKIGKSFVTDILDQVCFRIGGISCEAKTGAGFEDVLIGNLCESSSDSGEKTLVQSRILPVCNVCDEAGKVVAANAEAGYRDELEAVLNGFVSGSVKQKASRSGCKNGRLRAPIKTVGACVYAGTKESMAGALLGMDENDGRYRRTLYFVPEEVSEVTRRVDRHCLLEDSDELKTRIAERIVQNSPLLNEEGKLYFDASGCIANLRRCTMTLEARSALDLFIDSRGEKDGKATVEPQWGWVVAMAVSAFQHPTSPVITFEDMQITVAILAGICDSIAELTLSAVQATADKNTSWRETAFAGLSALFAKEGGTATWDRLRTARFIRKCPSLAGRAASWKDLWSMGLIEPVKGRAPEKGEAMDWVWRLCEEGTSSSFEEAFGTSSFSSSSSSVPEFKVLPSFATSAPKAFPDLAPRIKAAEEKLSELSVVDRLCSERGLKRTADKRDGTLTWGSGKNRTGSLQVKFDGGSLQWFDFSSLAANDSIGGGPFELFLYCLNDKIEMPRGRDFVDMLSAVENY